MQQLDPPQQDQLTAALGSVALQLRRLSDVSWLSPVIDPSDHEVQAVTSKMAASHVTSIFTCLFILVCLPVCLQGPLTDFSKRSRSAKFRLVPKFKKEKNNKNKETCSTCLSLPGNICLCLYLSLCFYLDVHLNNFLSVSQSTSGGRKK